MNLRASSTLSTLVLLVGMAPNAGAQDVALALAWGEDELVYRSVVLDGTRAAGANASTYDARVDLVRHSAAPAGDELFLDRVLLPEDAVAPGATWTYEGATDADEAVRSTYTFHGVVAGVATIGIASEVSGAELAATEEGLIELDVETGRVRYVEALRTGTAADGSVHVRFDTRTLVKSAIDAESSAALLSDAIAEGTTFDGFASQRSLGKDVQFGIEWQPEELGDDGALVGSLHWPGDQVRTLTEGELVVTEVAAFARFEEADYLEGDATSAISLGGQYYVWPVPSEGGIALEGVWIFVDGENGVAGRLGLRSI